MSRFPLVPPFVCFAAFACATTFAGAQPVTANPLLVTAEPPPLVEPPTRAVSPAVANLLRAAAPKYSPAPAAAQSTDAPEPDAREIDRPRNVIYRLPRYIVEEPKIFLPKERELLTPKGRLQLALKRHPGLRFGNLWFLRNDGIALTMLYEEERLERLRELTELTSVLSPAELTPTIKRAAEELRIRESSSAPRR